MFIMRRPRALACFLLATVWLVSVPDGFSPFLSRAAAQEPGDDDGVDEAPAPVTPNVAVPGEAGDAAAPQQGAAMADDDEVDAEGDASKPTAGRRVKAKKPSRPGAATPKATAKPSIREDDAAKPKPQPAAGVSFSKDVAPILVANCIGCHRQGRPGLERGKLDLTTFEKLMRGTTGGEKVVMAGKPGESHMILRIKGEEEPRMPQGGNNDGLAASVIARFEDWVNAGATLDAGLDPKAPIESYAASLADVERANVAKMSPDDRAAKITAAGLERWKKANPNLKPTITPGAHFVLFSGMPKERADATLKAMEAQYANLKRLLGPAAPEWTEKVSLYVFDDRKDFVEFVRTELNGEVEDDEAGRSNFSGAEPYVAVADPHDAAGKSEPASKRAKGRRRTARGDDGAKAGRGLVGLLTENMAEGAVRAQGKSPRWLASGVGLFLASLTDRRADDFRMLRQTALKKCRQGWDTLASQALGDGDGLSSDEFKAISFALVECLNSARFRELFPAAAKGLSQGGEKLDDVIKDVYGTTRDVFLNVTGEWVAEAYGGYGND